eukprot:CAMPEP_0194388066 /NCGR_PEP_ID=MMETSP0174-20130528/96252_1 /TAXON_ID=216777 /ORGANISM="Proboscia alata, Strain PI-D3" /LENGTH=69 /DNA_ID=CAMNT_0039178937 /DNA_START=57 /DNA_END=262 /DNA_ORIENTATION=-
MAKRDDPSDDEGGLGLETITKPAFVGSPITALTIATIAGLYWYLLVFGAAASSSGLYIPEWIPLIPGWP